MAIGRLITQTNDEPPISLKVGPRRSSRRGVLMWAERTLFVLSAIGLGYFVWVNVESRVYQSYENRELDAILASGPPVARSTPRAIPVEGSALGRVEIPRLGVSSVIRAGVDARTLRLAVGHIPGTAFPGDRGNIGLAAHRDTFFRKLKEIRAFDEIRIVTPEGSRSYEVERTNIVNPDDTWVLDETDVPSLTLVTCYPFTYVGAAPQRFIVRAVAKGSPDLIISALSPSLLKITTPTDDHRRVQSKGRLRQNHNSRQPRHRPRTR